uniref:Potassium channel domain-containing protein n=1 Tax=Plectus sambesii TaxID=2011161 RepID=A0A914X8W5_9BILA
MAKDWKDTVGVIAPHVLIMALLCTYIVVGALIFCRLDENLAKKPLQEIILFVFTTITTIGYGNIAPTTTEAQLFCILFSAFGIPLTFLALANLGKFFAEGYWIIVRFVTKEEIVQSTENERRLPLAVCLFFLLGYILLGGALFHFWEDQLPLVDAIYFSFISFTTIGFGDFYPTAGSVGHTIFIIVFLALGIVIVSTFISALSVYLHRIHYVGRSFTGAGDVDVWFGGQSMTVNELILLVADQFGVSPEELQDVLHDLDNIIDAVCEQTEQKMPLPQPVNTKHTIPQLVLHPSVSSETDSLLDECANENPLTVIIDQDHGHGRRPSLIRQASSSAISSHKRNSYLFDYTDANAHTLPANRTDLFKALGLVYNITHSPSPVSTPTRKTAHHF